jgi:hypothetical protein
MYRKNPNPQPTQITRWQACKIRIKKMDRQIIVIGIFGLAIGVLLGLSDCVSLNVGSKQPEIGCHDTAWVPSNLVSDTCPRSDQVLTHEIIGAYDRIVCRCPR